jgi:hypothetical protein
VPGKRAWMNEQQTSPATVQFSTNLGVKDCATIRLCDDFWLDRAQSAIIALFLAMISSEEDDGKVLRQLGSESDRRAFGTQESHFRKPSEILY